MKIIIVIAAVSLVLSCNQAKPPEQTTPAETIPAETVLPPPPDTTVMKFSDEEMWLSNLLSDKKEIRSAAFKKYLAVRDTSRSVSDLMTGYIKTYFSTFPKEFLDQFATLKNREQEKITDDIAHEFRASGTNYKIDLDEYFNGITNTCTDCPASLLNTLKVLKQKIYHEVIKVNS